jgi:hypothetical protein
MVEAMSGPTPQTHFEAWGQALIGITNSNTKAIDEYKKGLLALIMIADTNREWAAWYYFTSKSELDIQLMQNYTSEVLAEKPKFPSHFTTPKAMVIDELCGNDSNLNARWRRASLMGPPRDIGKDNFEFLLLVQSAPPAQGSQDRIGDRPTTKPIHLRFKRRDGASDVTEYPLGFGWLNYARIYESYNFLAPYHSKHEKLRAMEKMLVRPGGPEIRLGI